MRTTYPFLTVLFLLLAAGFGPLSHASAFSLTLEEESAAPTASDTEPGQTDAEPVETSRLAHLHLTGLLLETPVVDQFSLSGDKYVSLKELTDLLKKARADKNIDGLILTVDDFHPGSAQLEELQHALAAFRQSDKPVYVHVDSLDMGSFALFSAASYLSVVPTADVWITGFYGESLHIKGLLDKIGVEADILQMGDYKSAGELFTRTEPSPAAAENINWLFDALYDHYITQMAHSRDLDVEEMTKIIDEGPYTAEEALEHKLVDAVQYRDAFLEEVRSRYDGAVEIDNRYGEDSATAVDWNNPFAFFSLFSQMMAPHKTSGKNAVGLIYVEGVIVPGHAKPDLFGSSSNACSGDLRKTLERAAEDPTIKAVVLRVDSPGGSALASEIILHATKQVKAKKPFVVSMGNVAGSGGYYVACAADTIFADETTITASIGVIGGKFITHGLWDKLGVNWYPYQRGANADLLNSSYPFTESQRQRMLGWMQTVYDQFKSNVLSGRGEKLTKSIDEIAGGRVFTGRQARDLGLVDKLGGLQDAIAYAAGQADLTDYDVRVIPEPVDLMTQLVGDFFGPTDQEKPTDVRMTTSSILASGKLQATPQILSFLQKLEPHRIRIFLQALQRLDLLQTENVITMMPQDWIVH